MSIKECLKKNPRGQNCSKCNVTVPECSLEAKACLCWKCTAHFAANIKHDTRKTTETGF